MGRYRYLTSKLVWTIGSLIFVIVLNFFLFRVLPGDPVRQGIRDPRLRVESLELIRVRFGLDKPLINCFQSINPLKFGDCAVNPLETQFFIYVGNLLRGELGISYDSNRPVATILAERLWNTIILLAAGQVLSIVVGIALGLVAAWKSRTAIDHTALIISLITWSLPTFWLGVMLLIWGSQQFGLPIGGKETPGTSFSSVWAAWWDLGRHLILPTLTFTIIFIGEYMLIMRSTVLEVLSEDYILTARAKGLNTVQILRDHALRNAMLPMVTIIALNLSFTVAGAIQIESVYSWPGLGLAIFEAVAKRDYPILQGAFLLLAVCVIFANLCADMIYSLLDPRIHTTENAGAP